MQQNLPIFQRDERLETTTGQTGQTGRTTDATDRLDDQQKNDKRTEDRMAFSQTDFHKTPNAYYNFQRTNDKCASDTALCSNLPLAGLSLRGVRRFLLRPR